MTGIWPRITLERETREELPARSVELKALAGLECCLDALFLLGATVPAGIFVLIPAVGMKADGAACPPAERLDLTTEPLGQPEQTSQRLSAQPNEADSSQQHLC